MQVRPIKQQLIDFHQNAFDNLTRMSEASGEVIMDYAARYVQEFKGKTFKDAIRELQAETVGIKEIVQCAKQSQTVVFSTDQALIFREVTKDYADRLDYRLPFPCMILQFTTPVPMFLMNTRVSDEPSIDHLLALILVQKEVDEDFMESVRLSKIETSHPLNFLSVPIAFENAPRGAMANRLIAIWSDWNHSRFGWFSDSSEEIVSGTSDDEMVTKVRKSWAEIKRFAIACIGYINCENIYLHREDVPDKVNRKREAKGKSKLEPYYVCRIRGVNYDGNGATGEGSTHGIRYDVRGHFRRLTTGKTTWVRPHQRGLANELYVPKIYVVDKAVQP